MKKTPLYDEHVALGAKMLDFAGWQMPIRYKTGINDEHNAVRTSAGLFDVSHMGEITITGPDAAAFLDYSCLNTASKLKPGRAQYSMIANDSGGLVDDIFLYQNAEDNYFMIANASNIDAVMKHLSNLAKDYDVSLVNVSDSWALLALQGPGAAVLLARYVEHDLTKLRRNRKVVTRFNDKTIDLARTGYTGEDGFEILCRPDDVVAIWRDLLEAGAVAAGLAARDSLRLEAGFPLFGHEFDATTNPLCSDYSWVVKDKDFYGREAIWDKPCDKKLVGIVLNERGVCRQGYKIFADDSEIGEVSSGTVSPLTRKSLALAWVDSKYAEPDTEVAVSIRDRKLSATITKPPFYG